MTRQPGFYWVRRGDTWEIAEWCDDWWMLCGNDCPAYFPYEGWGPEIDEIDERQIERVT